MSTPAPRRARRYRSHALLCCLALAACGGGGGGGTADVNVDQLRLDAAPLTITGDSGELLVSLPTQLAAPPVLLQVTIEIPPQLSLPVNDRLRAARPLTTLDGELVDGAFVVLCGDADNPTAAPLAAGPLFHLRLLATQPRSPGAYQVRLRDVRAATAAGVESQVNSEPVFASVVLQD